MIRAFALALPLLSLLAAFVSDAVLGGRHEARHRDTLDSARAAIQRSVGEKREDVERLLRRLQDEPRLRAALAAGHAGGVGSARALKEDTFLQSWLDESLTREDDLLLLVGGDGRVALGLAGRAARGEVGDEVFLDRQVSFLMGELAGSDGTVGMLWSGPRLRSVVPSLAALDRSLYMAAGTMIRFASAGSAEEPAAGVALVASALDLGVPAPGVDVVLADGREPLVASFEAADRAADAAQWMRALPALDGGLATVELAGVPYRAAPFAVDGLVEGPVRAAVLVSRVDELAQRRAVRIPLFALFALSLVPAAAVVRQIRARRAAAIAPPASSVVPAPAPGSGGAALTADLAGRTLLGRYAVRRRLGAGGFGAVYEADHLELDCKVAVKVLEVTSRALAAESAERFRREAKAASRLAHPCAVKIFDRGETEDGLLWIAMEYLEGETLDVYRRRTGTLAPADVVELFVPICEVLAEAHEKGIVHRDLKPQNVMLLSAGGKRIPKVFDFGIAGLEADKSVTQTGAVVGTPSYMAPEQWDGLQFADARSDLYSLGVMAYECLCGRLPLEAGTALALLNKIRYEEPRDLVEASGGKVPPSLARAVMRAISKNPEERPRSALEWKSELSLALRAA